MAATEFETKLFKIKDWVIVRLPEDASAKLPSRGMVMVSGSLNNIPFKALLEPDGIYNPDRKPSHWFKPDITLLQKAGVKSGDLVHVIIAPTKEWVEPDIPADMHEALIKDSAVHNLWKDITPMARWDWLRWVRAVKTEETRKKHIDIMISKLSKGMRRPCCFNRNLCSEPYVSKNWVLLETRD